MTDTTPAAVEILATELPDTQWKAPRLHRAADTLRALSAQLEAANQRADAAYAKGKAEGLREAVSLPKRVEQLGGQSYAYVRVEEILALIPADTPEPVCCSACSGFDGPLGYTDCMGPSDPADTPAIKPTPQEGLIDTVGVKPANMTVQDAAKVLLDAYAHTEKHVTHAAANEYPQMGFINAGAVVGAALRAIAGGRDE